MAFELKHGVVSTQFTPHLHKVGGLGYGSVDVEGELQILHPGRLDIGVIANFQHRTQIETPSGPGGIFRTETVGIPVKITIYTPDGLEFTGSDIGLYDLQRVRNLRGLPIGPWRYKLSGEGGHRALEELDTISDARGYFAVDVIETVASESTGPLLSPTTLDGSRQSFNVDLFRVGTFIAELSNIRAAEWRGTLSLIDPDGVVVRSTNELTLTFPVALATLGKSRGPDGSVRLWQIEVAANGGVVIGHPRLSATVIAQSRITTAAVQSRIQFLLGSRGASLRVYGQNAGGDALARLVITDPMAVETLEMYSLFDKILEQDKQDEGVDLSDMKANVVYTLGRRSQDFGYGVWIDVSTLLVGAIDVTVGPGVRLGAAVPAVRLGVQVSGEVKLKLGPATIGTAMVNGGRLEMEVGIVLGGDGAPQTVCWSPDKLFDIDLHWSIVLTLGAIAGPLIGLGLLGFSALAESLLNGQIAAGVRSLFADPNLAPRLLMIIFGVHRSYRAIRVEGGSFVFEHAAPPEHDPRPRPIYAGAIGRALIEVRPGSPQFVPPFLGDTWARANLSKKIDHIVVVMMENRSYDHVLGYRAQGTTPDGADGLTEATVQAIQAAAGEHIVRKLSEASFAANALGKMTRLPQGVGHKLDDVREQLAAQVQRADGGGQINHPKGFVDNFANHLGSDEENRKGVVPGDVLGYYEASDLPFFAYLAQHYGYCDRYFCSHPGPTMPNRMYSLTGDLQYDRFGAPIPNNNHGDNIMLSRATTIYDLLTRNGVSWRVYESEPSVTMLRMFARYATNTTDIVPFSRLQADVSTGNLPAFTAIEPAMHHHPEDDDHPDADMYRGQIFLQKVYEALRSNPAVWRKTLLLITYDEHGGFYDHVVPPLADALFPPGIGGHPGNLSAAGGAQQTMLRRPPGDDDPPPPPGGGGEDPPPPSPRPAPPRPPPAPPQTRERVYIRYGVRVPTFVVSPWVTPGKGPSLVLDHCSILKTVLARFCGGSKPFLSDRVGASQSFEAFLGEAQPRLDIPPSPPLGSLPIEERLVPPGGSQIVTPPLSRKQLREGEADYHQISGWLARTLGR